MHHTMHVKTSHQVLPCTEMALACETTSASKMDPNTRHFSSLCQEFDPICPSH